jgi:hypothetical protein
VEQSINQPDQSVRQSEQSARQAYETPAILETFDAQEVMGAAEGLVGTGSVSPDSRVWSTFVK